jgi:hypothetical protein
MGHTSFLAYADDVIIVGENIDTIKKNTEALLDAVSVEVTPEKTKNMLMSRRQKTGKTIAQRYRTGPLKMWRS